MYFEINFVDPYFFQHQNGMAWAPNCISTEDLNVTANQLHMIDFLCGFERTSEDQIMFITTKRKTKKRKRKSRNC